MTDRLTGRLLLAPGRPASRVLDEQQLGSLLRSVETSMRAESIADDLIERVLHRLIYGQPLGAVDHTLEDTAR